MNEKDNVHSDGSKNSILVCSMRCTTMWESPEGNTLSGSVLERTVGLQHH